MRILTLAFVLLSAAIHAGETEHSVKPEHGLVPNAKTAIAIAIAVWTPIYGEATLEDEKPFTAKLANGVWSVRGSLSKGWKGGVAEAEISQKNGEILRVSHGK